MFPERTENKNTQPTPEEMLQAGAEFIEHFGIEVSPIEQPEQFVEALSQLNPRFQGGRDLVRWELEADQTDWPEDTQQVIMRAAEGMRMLEPETSLTGYFNAVIALGGARQSNLDRTRYAAEAAQKAIADFYVLIVAGSNRVLKEAEQEATANYAPGAKTEFDLCVAAAKVVAKEHPDLHIEYFLSKSDKAGTPEVIEDVLDYLKDKGTIKEDSRVAAVTTQIYQASTELDIARVARKFGITNTFSAGNPSDPETVAKRTPATYLSEAIRTLRAATLAAQAEKE